MNRLFLFLPLFLLAIPSAAQDDEGLPFEDEQEREVSHGGIFGGGGGVSATWHFLNTDILNAELAHKNFPTVDRDGMFLFGGHGYAYIVVIPNLRVGGFGAGGSVTASKSDGYLYHEVKFSTDMGGATVEYVIPFGRFHLTPGIALGGGTNTLVLTRLDEGSKSWPLLPKTGNTREEFTNGFFLWMPQLSLEYEIHPLAVVSIAGGYLGMSGDEWKLDERFPVTGTPAFNFGRAFVRANLTVGFFISE
ncbi:MAG: hypothetical protein QHI48_10300 [Bacteroidota bacterium]|nr:hypothetical protein [Bacteroidota bacterium]